uniref:Putative secreted peptide n=1 Tax=Anopheles braziliensis TaxID=58242 RepID=A0A2M3ZPQ4_9DIPT
MLAEKRIAIIIIVVLVLYSLSLYRSPRCFAHNKPLQKTGCRDVAVVVLSNININSNHKKMPNKKKMVHLG